MDNSAQSKRICTASASFLFFFLFSFLFNGFFFVIVVKRYDQIDNRSYKLLGSIGEGSYGRVYKACRVDDQNIRDEGNAKENFTL